MSRTWTTATAISSLFRELAVIVNFSSGLPFGIGHYYKALKFCTPLQGWKGPTHSPGVAVVHLTFP